MFDRAISGLGLFVMILLAWLLSSQKRRFPWRVVVGGLGLQLVLALLILMTKRGRELFEILGGGFEKTIGFVDEGCVIVFGDNFRDYYFAFRVLPTIIFFSSLMAVLYHMGVMQFIIRQLGRVLQHTLGTSGAESLSAAANIFVGQTEAPFVIRPFLPVLTKSELMAIMTGGFATVAGGVMALYIGWNIDAGHLLTASVISAPAGLVIAKIILPETQTPVTAGQTDFEIPKETSNLIEAATQGASEGLKLALNVAAMLIAFTGLITLLDFLLSESSLYIIQLFDESATEGITFAKLCGWVFSPLARLMGIEWKDCVPAGQLLGYKMFANELIAFKYMKEMLPGVEGAAHQLSPRSTMIMTYALTGFSSFASIGIQVGGIGGLCQERKKDLAAIGLKAMLGGTLACCMTACIAGMVAEESKPVTKEVEESAEEKARRELRKEIQSVIEEMGKKSESESEKTKGGESADGKADDTSAALVPDNGPAYLYRRDWFTGTVGTLPDAFARNRGCSRFMTA